MNDNPLASLAMRERAADKLSEIIDGWEVIRKYHERGSFSGDAAVKSIRALTTTFTDAELLAAAMRLPEVRALADVALEAKTQLENRAYESVNFYNGEKQKYYAVRQETFSEICAALAPFTKGGE